MENNQLQPKRELSVVTQEIKELTRQAQSTAVCYIIEIGRRLVEAKELVPFGEWTNWLNNEVEYSQSTANNFMKMYEEYGSQQLSLFGAVTNSQTIANLPYSKALKLISIPADEREDFAKEVDAEHISVRELDKAIKERNEALEAARVEKERADEIAEKLKQIESLSAESEKKDTEAEELRKKVNELQNSLSKAKQETEIAKDKLKEAQKNPKIPKDKLEAIKTGAAETARIEAEKKISDELNKMKDALAKAEQDAEKSRIAADTARYELEEIKKRLKTANPDVTVFKSLYDNVQELILKMKTTLNKIREDDAETAEKLQKALKALGEQF